jgi:RNA ligase
MEINTKTLFDDLMALCNSSEAFYFQDFTHEYGHLLRIFNYRMASYTDFLQPGALHCRGTMFVEQNGHWRLVSLPSEKFFNLNENPMTMGVDLSRVQRFELKADGSLISTYVLPDKFGDNNLFLKSKGSISSNQAKDATEWLNRPENAEFEHELWRLANQGYTACLEWCSPNNRVVLPYQEEQLIMLHVRDNTDGEYVDFRSVPVLANNADDTIQVSHPASFIEMIPYMEGIEGYILVLNNPYQRIKMKTHWYLVQHRAKDSVNSDRRLFEAVVCDAHDDLRSLFHDDEWVLGRIQWMEDLVGHEFNHMVSSVEAFYEANNHLSRKDYAIKGQQEIEKKFWFSLAMNLYLGKTNDYKAFMMSKYREYGIKDQQKGEE